MENWEREIIRSLAREKLEISKLPIMEERKKLWTGHNDLQGNIPPIHFEMWTVGDKGFNYECKCVSPEAVAIESQLGNRIANHKMVGDDRVVTDDFVCSYKSSFVPFGLNIEKTNTSGVGFHINSQIKDLSNTDIIKPSTMSFDYEGSVKWQEFVQEQIGDILNVRMGMNSIGVCLTNEIVHRMEMDNMFMAMYDNPDEFHYMMDSLSNDYVVYIKELEKRGMLCKNNGNDHLNQGSFGFTSYFDNTAIPITTKDCWGYMDSQETVGISADMFNEFFFPYYKKVSDNFGLLSYGCCEPVNGFWEKSLSKLENLRKISISPWCDEEYMGEQLRNREVIYLRKPSPNFVGVGKYLDEEGFREHIRKTLRAANGCKIEFAFRDVYKLEGELNKPRRAVEIVREEIQNQ